MAGLETQLRGPNANSKCSSRPGAHLHHNDLVPNETDPDHLVNLFVQLFDVPEDNLLDHPALAVVDGIPGCQSALAPMSAVPPASAHIGGLALACDYSEPHAVVPDD